MANSAKKGEKLEHRNPGVAIFSRCLSDIRKNNSRQNLEKKKIESCSQNSNISESTSNQFTSEVLKTCSISCQEECLLPNDNLHDNNKRQAVYSKKDVDYQDAQGMQTSRRFKNPSYFNNNDEYNAYTRHDDRLEKIYNFSDDQKCLLKSNNSYTGPSWKHNSCFKYSESSNSIQVQIPRHNTRSHNKSYDSGECNRSDSKFKHGSSSSLQKDFNKNYSKFKEFSNFQEQSSYNTKKNDKVTQHKDSSKYSSTRNFHKNSDRFCQNNKSEPSFRLNQNSKIQEDVKEDSFSDDNLNLDSHFRAENKNAEYRRSFTELDETLKDGQWKNMKITLKQSVSDSVTNTSPALSPSLISSVSNAPVSTILSASAPLISDIISSVTIPSVHPASNTAVTVLETNSNGSSSNVVYDPNLTNSSIDMSLSSNDSIPIPPPISCDSLSASEKTYANAGKNGTFLPNNGAESREVDSYADAHFSLPNSEHLQAISNFIKKIVEERLVHSHVAVKVVCDLNRLFKNHFEGNVIDYYGSYYCDLAITTSDINLMLKADVSIRKDFMFEIHKVLSKELERYHVHQYEEGRTAYKSKINFTHPKTGINCELAYLGKNTDKILKMGKFLKKICDMDSRTKELIITVKIWAEHFNINDVEDGKLHPVGFALSVIHFLQHCEQPVLPIFKYEEQFQDMESLPQNNSSVGALWLNFLWYYGFVFNWEEDILTVTSMERVSKTSKKWENYWIAIEDLYTGKNIAVSVVNKDVADNIKSYFKITYNYFLNGPEIIPSFENAENENNKESSSQLEFSFNDCFLEQDEDVCEKCYEIDDVCDECKKKIYVQPIAPMPKMTDDFLEVIEKALLTVYNKYMLSEEEVNQRREFVKNLEVCVRKIYPDAQMNLFGSSANGFGFNKSDLDICMTFKSKTEFKTSAVLCDLRRLLRRDEKFTNVIAIFSAQIPILKFRYEPKGWRGDISLNNVLAVHNSELLYKYSLIDKRCKILGCALKLLAKKAQIADVTEKALSSYSYLIMAIHFLQQTDPPVLPVLQDNQFREGHLFIELSDNVENCNVWFCREIDYIKEKFKTKNHTRVGQLFLDLLDYYCSFDNNQVITIRQKEILPFCEEMRSARLFHIQDPFLENKNLGCVVSPTKARETKSVFNRARMLFGTPKKETPNDLENYFFSTMSLTGRIQKEALCDFCGKFGHDKNDCRQSSPQRNFFRSYPKYKFNIYKRKPMNRQHFMKK